MSRSRTFALQIDYLSGVRFFVESFVTDLFYVLGRLNGVFSTGHTSLYFSSSLFRVSIRHNLTAPLVVVTSSRIRPPPTVVYKLIER